VLDRQFKTLTGFSPLSWQSRLFSEYFEKGEIPAAVDIPTGLGKTAVMALWLIARARGAQLPRRLVYVVDRRAVVDQATEFADLLCEKLDSPESADLKKALELGDRSLPISTLRGQHVDNREWLEDPASTAIIVGTVDMIGSLITCFPCLIRTDERRQYSSCASASRSRRGRYLPMRCGPSEPRTR